MRAPSSEVDKILDEVIELQAEHGIYDLRLFKSLVSADQYRRHYYKVAEYVERGAKVLDWGCGAGHFSYGLAELGYRTHGNGFYDFELHPYISSGFQFMLGSFDDPVSLPYPDDQFDAVVSVGVLEHVRESGGDELTSLKEVWRILRPGAHFLCFHLPNQLSVAERLNVARKAEHHHAYKYDRRAIEQLCEQSSFDLIEVDRYGALPRNIWNTFPDRYRNSKMLAHVYNGMDDVLARLFSPFCQNFMFVARKPEGLRR